MQNRFSKISNKLHFGIAHVLLSRLGVKEKNKCSLVLAWAGNKRHTIDMKSNTKYITQAVAKKREWIILAKSSIIQCLKHILFAMIK